MTDDDHLWDLWAEARIDCEVGGRTRCLRGEGAEPLPARAPLFTVTAHNPGGVERDDAINAADERALESELSSAGVAFWSATGHSVDDSWREPGVAVVGLTRSEACALGLRYGQLGVYELTDDELRVVRCADEEVVRTRRRSLSDNASGC